MVVGIWTHATVPNRSAGSDEAPASQIFSLTWLPHLGRSTESDDNEAVRLAAGCWAGPAEPHVAGPVS